MMPLKHRESKEGGDFDHYIEKEETKSPTSGSAKPSLMQSLGKPEPVDELGAFTGGLSISAESSFHTPSTGMEKQLVTSSQSSLRSPDSFAPGRVL